MTKRTFRFFALAFAASWAMWGAAFLLKGECGSAASQILLTAGTFSPSVFGLFLTFKESGKKGLLALLRSMAVPSGLKKSGVFLVSAPLFALVFSLIIASVSGAKLSGGPVFSLPLVFLYIFFLGGPLGEEAGWRGYALKDILSKWGPYKAALCLGSAWALWHLPLFFIAGTVQKSLLFFGVVPALAGYFVYTLFVSLLLTFLWIDTSQSLFFAALLHAVCNFCAGIFIMAAPIESLYRYFLIFVCLSVLCVFGREIRLKKRP